MVEETRSIGGYHAQKRKEKSTYSPSDLRTEDSIVFLRYCPSLRIRCYQMVDTDSPCRPHEILKLKIKDIVFKQVDGKSYAEILVNGKSSDYLNPVIRMVRCTPN